MPITLITIYYRNCSTLLLTTFVNSLLYLIQKLNFTLGKHVCIGQKHSICKVLYYPVSGIQGGRVLKCTLCR